MTKPLFAALVATALLLGACAATPPEGPAGPSGSFGAEPDEARNRARIHTELASLYYTRGNFAVALEELRIARSADEAYAPTYSMLGLVYSQLREEKLAQQSFERALKLAPNDGDINHNYGWFLCQTGREAQSIKFFLQALSNPLYATPWRSYSAAGICTLRSGNARDAEQYFERALRLEPDDASALLPLGGIRYRQGKFDEARRLVARFNKLMDPTAESLWLALRIERGLGERVAEQSFANQLRRRYPTSPEYQALLRGKFD